MNWGQWGSKFNTEGYIRMIEKAVDAGVTSFDHADIYGHYTTEAEFGAALRQVPGLRQKIQLITKCGICLVTPNRPEYTIKHYNTSKEHIIRSAEQSLKNLYTDHIDLLLIHRPDPLTDPQEVAEAFSSLKQSGKVLHFGVSNFSAEQTALLHEFFPMEVNQVEISLIRTGALTNGVLDYCMRMGIMAQSWSPLGGGVLYAETDDERSRRIKAVAAILGDQYQAGLDQMLLAWLMQHPAGIRPVLGTTRPERLQAAMAARNIHMTREEWFMLWRAASGHEVP